MGSNKKEYLVENMRKLLFSEIKVMHQIDVTQNIVTARGSKTLWGGGNKWVKYKASQNKWQHQCSGLGCTLPAVVEPPPPLDSRYGRIRITFFLSSVSWQQEFSPDEVNFVIHKIKPRKAPGCDGVMSFFKWSDSVVYNSIYKSQITKFRIC